MKSKVALKSKRRFKVKYILGFPVAEVSDGLHLKLQTPKHYQ